MITLRSVIVTGLAILFCFGAYHRGRAETGEPIDRRAEGWGLLIGIRLTALCLFVVVARWVWNPNAMPIGDLDLPEPVRWAGVGVMIIAEAWLMWMFRTLGRNITDTVVTRREAHFVRSGPYQFVRNPMYIGLLFLMPGIGLAIGNWVPMVAGGLIFTLLAIRTTKEEHYLLARFPQEYGLYMQQVGRFWPTLRR